MITLLPPKICCRRIFIGVSPESRHAAESFRCEGVILMQKSAAAKTDRKNLPFSRSNMENIHTIRGILRTGKEILQELNSDGNTRVSSLTLEKCEE